MRSPKRRYNDTIVLFSRIPLSKMRKDGGWGWWPIGKDAQRLTKLGIKYVVSVLNKPNDPEHRKPSFVAVLNKNKPPQLQKSTRYGKTRQRLYLSGVANLSGINRANVVVKRDFYYTSLSQLGLKVGRLKFSRIQSLAAAGRAKKPFRGADPGPIAGGTRENLTWEARSHPLTIKLEKYLKAQGWAGCDGKGWRPDILMEKNRKHRVVVEVKPTAAKHDLITAVGQILCYRAPHKGAVISIIAAGGAFAPGLCRVMDRLAIKRLNMTKRTCRRELGHMLGEIA